MQSNKFFRWPPLLWIELEYYLCTYVTYVLTQPRKINITSSIKCSKDFCVLFQPTIELLNIFSDIFLEFNSIIKHAYGCCNPTKQLNASLYSFFLTSSEKVSAVPKAPSATPQLDN